MKKICSVLLAALAVAALFTPTPALAGVYDDTCIAGEDAKACLERAFGTLLELTAQAEAQVVQLQQAQTSAASAGDGAEVARLERELTAVTAERDRLKDELDAAKAEIAELKGNISDLQTRMAGLEEQMTAFLEAEAARPVAKAEPATPAEEPASEPASTPAGEARLAVYERPELDPTVYGRMGYVGYTPEIPSPIAHPNVPWRDAGNCLRVENPANSEYHMYVRVQGADFYLDDSGHTTRDEVLLAPGRSIGHCMGESAPVTRTAARISTAPSAKYDWDGRRQVSVERSSRTVTYANRYGADRVDDDGPPFFRE